MSKCISHKISIILPSLRCRWYKKMFQNQREMLYLPSLSQHQMDLERREQLQMSNDMELYRNSLRSLQVQEIRKLEYTNMILTNHQKQECLQFLVWASQRRKASNLWGKWEDLVMSCYRMRGNSIQPRATILIIMKVWDICQERITTRVMETSTIKCQSLQLWTKAKVLRKIFVH